MTARCHPEQGGTSLGPGNPRAVTDTYPTKSSPPHKRYPTPQPSRSPTNTKQNTHSPHHTRRGVTKTPTPSCTRCLATRQRDASAWTRCVHVLHVRQRRDASASSVRQRHASASFHASATRCPSVRQRRDACASSVRQRRDANASSMRQRRDACTSCSVRIGLHPIPQSPTGISCSIKLVAERVLEVLQAHSLVFLRE